MLISRLPEEESGRAGDVEIKRLDDNSNEYQAADELFEIMTQNPSFEGDKLLNRDLVILYKNTDVENKPITNLNEQANNSSNQYVETIIYKDEQGSEGSDVSEYVSNEDMNDVFAINKERIDLLNNIGDTLCHKFGNIDIQTSNLATEYERHFLSNDPFIKEQLKSFHAISNSKHSDSTVLPASLLDYICCKRLEDNYTFYMDNIIKYVQHTIEQLRRISNGDYLTDKAKEKWREVSSRTSQMSECKKTVLASSTSIPLRVEGKRSGHRNTWDDIVHSEMDVRSLSKILEKKIIVEVPKILCGSYRLFSKRCKDNLIITCKKDKQSVIREVKEEESRVDVVLKLQRSESGNVISNIDSIMILQPLPIFCTEPEPCSEGNLALEFEQVYPIVQCLEPETKIIEIDEDNDIIPEINTIDQSIPDKEVESETTSELTNNDFLPHYNGDEDNHCSSNRAETNIKFLAVDDLCGSIQRVNVQSPLLEENEDSTKKNKSSTRVRIKSPYENQSHILEEKKRKKLLEIREKREKKKMALSENCKITKHKFGRGAIMPQSSYSVTKLSITNKSFYNSIYGQAVKINNKNPRKYDQRDLGIELEEHEENQCKDSPLTTPEKNSQKYINRSYFLDDADTEIMHLQINQIENQDETKDTFSPSTSALSSNDVAVNLNLLKQLMGPSTTDFSLTDTSSSLQQNVLFDESFEKENARKNALMSTRSTQVIAPTNTPKNDDSDKDNNHKTKSSVECRRSIDKIYHLMKKIAKVDSLTVRSSASKIVTGIVKLDTSARRGSSTVQISDSGTSIKHQLTSSNPSYFSFEKTNTGVKTLKQFKKQEQSASVIPKVIISSKLPVSKFNNKINNKENKKLTSIKTQENPLKAISKLLHEFDNVQKTRHKSNDNELKRNKKAEILTTEDKCSSRPILKRTTKQEQHIKDSERVSSRFAAHKEKRRQPNEPLRTPHQQFQTEESTIDKTSRRKIADIIDEVKELRGEAVRGPSKKLSRLNSLAQPKRSYGQPHHDDIQNRFGKRIVTDRLHKQPMTPVSIPERSMGYTNIKNKQRKGSEGFTSSTKQLHTAGQPLDRLPRTKRSVNNSPSPEGKRSPVSVTRPSYNQSNINSAPEPLNRKMVAVETYVKSHYGRASHALNLGDTYSAQKSRVPLIPTDIDLDSMTSSRSTDESTALGKKLHYMIDSMINTNMPALSAVTECNESTSKLDKTDPDDNFIQETLKYEITSGSEYHVDIFQDKNIVTAVSGISKDSNDTESIDDNNINTTITKSETKHTCQAAEQRQSNELQKLENALCRQLSSGTFQKRLKIKKLTLTPKQSLEKVFIVQSGDAGSLVVKSTLSQKIDFKTDSLAELKILSNNGIDFGFTKFPMHIATVGYAFPHRLVKYNSTTKIQSLDDEDAELNDKKSSMTSDYMPKSKSSSNKSIQCFKCIENKAPQESIKQRESSDYPFLGTEKACLDKFEKNAEKVQENEQNTKDEIGKLETIDCIGETDVKNKISDNINNSTSLDILVGLLNEIKKITSCQAHLTKQNDSNIDLESKELEIILNRAAVQESSVDYSVNNGMSVTSLNNLQQLKPRASNYSLYLPSTEGYRDIIKTDKNISTSTSLPYQSLIIDKVVNENIFQKAYINRWTEVPSRFLPVNVSTNVTDSLIKIINKSSSQSLYSFSDCQTISNSMSNEVKEPNKKARTSIHSLTTPIFKKKITYEEEKYEDSLKSHTTHTMKNTGYSVVDFDPVMKMKRDILVTVYSILVLTVFAALSFPELVYV